jgi:hypothetical protein
MWREKSADGSGKCLDAYRALHETVRRYVAAVIVFFAPTGKALLDRVHGHRYTSPFLQRLASKAASKTDVSGTASASH